MIIKNKATILLSITNIVVYFIVYFMFFDEISNATLSSANLVEVGSICALNIAHGEWYRLLTSMFLHIRFSHLFNNILFLILFGTILESMIGSSRYIITCIGGGLIGNIAVFLSYYNIYRTTGRLHVMAGSSVCIFAILGAMLALGIKSSKEVGKIPAIGFLIGITMFILSGITDSEVCLTGHIGGLLGGFLIGLLFAYTEKRRNQKEKRNF